MRLHSLTQATPFLAFLADDQVVVQASVAKSRRWWDHALRARNDNIRTFSAFVLLFEGQLRKRKLIRATTSAEFTSSS